MPPSRALPMLGAILVANSLPLPAKAQSCEELWFLRNKAFHEAGFCFKTRRALRTFGNAGCRYENEAEVPLNARQRALVSEIRATEREQGCGR